MGAREGMKPLLRYRNLLCPAVIACLCFLLFTTALTASGQEPRATESPSAPDKTQNPTSQDATAKPKSDSASEISQTESAVTFKVRVNLVQVRVIVREPSGKAVGNLTREDFLLYDQGKLQNVTNFSVETPETRLERVAAAVKTQENASEQASKTPTLPERFVSMVFDDIHLSLQDATFVRQQADKFLDSVGANDRVAIYSTSGQSNLEFTADKEALHRTVLSIMPRPLFPQSLGADCPDVSYY